MDYSSLIDNAAGADNMTLERLYRSEGGIGRALLNSRDEVVGTVDQVWTGEGSPAGSIIKIGNSRYPKFFLVCGD
jgi:hypothetical protein